MSLDTLTPVKNRDDFRNLWCQVGDVLIADRAHTDARFDRLEGRFDRLEGDVEVLKTDVAELKTDVAELKTDVATIKIQLTDLDSATQRGFERIDARFEQLFGWLKLDELGGLRKGSRDA